MKTLYTAVAIALAGMAFTAQAEDKKPTAQQSKMTTCNKDAGDKKGDERKAFMKECLSADGGGKKMTQQDKMKKCNADATGKTGDERKKFMSSCLKG